MKFAVFDLDHTLLPVDSGENWSRWLVRAAGMDVALMDARIEAYAEAYRKGAFSADEFMGFQAGLLAACRRQDLEKWRATYIDACVRPHLRPEALDLVESRRKAGFEPVLASGTHAFVTGAVAPLFGIRHLVAARPEEDAFGEFTGRIAGAHSYGEGKLVLLRGFLESLGAADEASGWRPTATRSTICRCWPLPLNAARRSPSIQTTCFGRKPPAEAGESWIFSKRTGRKCLAVLSTG